MRLWYNGPAVPNYTLYFIAYVQHFVCYFLIHTASDTADDRPVYIWKCIVALQTHVTYFTSCTKIQMAFCRLANICRLFEEGVWTCTLITNEGTLIQTKTFFKIWNLYFSYLETEADFVMWSEESVSSVRFGGSTSKVTRHAKRWI